MQAVKLTAFEKGDGKVLEGVSETPITLHIMEFAAVQEGMTSGKHSTMLHFKDAAGNSYVTQITGAIFEGLHGWYKGQTMRWDEK